MTVPQFRFVLIASTVIGILASITDLLFPALLTDGFHQAQEAQDSAFSALRLSIIGLISLVVLATLISATYGLFMLRPWAPRLALISTLLALFLLPAMGGLAQSGTAIALAYISSYLWGIVLFQAFWPPFSAHFRKSDG